MTEHNAETAYPIGGVVRSNLDRRCWFATLENVDIATGEANCSVSVLRVKRYVREIACHMADVAPADTVWVRTSDNVWNLYVRDDLRTPPVTSETDDCACGHPMNRHESKFGCMAELGDNGSGSVVDAVFCRCSHHRLPPAQGGA